jgi:minor extracellular serine protease Vpr
MNALYRLHPSFGTRVRRFVMVTMVLSLLYPVHAQVDPNLTEALRRDGIQSFTVNETAYVAVTVSKSIAHQKLDPALRSLLQREQALAKRVGPVRDEYSISPFAVIRDERGELWVDIMIEVEPGFGVGMLSSIGARNIVQAGSIVSMIAPIDRIEELASQNDIRFIELGTRKKQLNKAGKTDIGADEIHDGIDLPQQYKGNGVIVGVIDSGIDFSHPDFNNETGTRIQFLYEYTQTDPLEWSKQQIDTNPVSVTQRDLDDGFGHGTHVTGTAAGGGKVNGQYSGVAPESDIIFVKGMINGGFSDNAVVGGCQYIFEKADALGKPVVINLSLGGMFGPLDGSSLYEQALSNLTGPGKIIVAAAGNSGFDLIHAGGQLPASTRNVTILLSDNPQNSFLNIWYTPGVISQVAVGAFIIDENEDLFYLGNTDFVPVGSFMNYTPFVYDEILLAEIGIDAQTITDPRNGDGNILIDIVGDPENNVNLNELIWVVIYDSNNVGRFDMWSFGGEFWPQQVGIDGVNEVPGDTFLTIGAPATAHKIIAVGSYVTTNSWTDIDNQTRQWLNPDPTRQTNDPVVPSLGQKSYFSSFGPTRDGRTAPDISAPGELVFSALSSHLTEGQGYQRGMVLQGGSYAGQQGTSMASPHVTGVVALMLQADPTLTYEEVLQILQETARTDSWMGTVPNNGFGAGKIDAYAAVASVAGTEPGGGDPTVLRYFDPNSDQRTWVLDNFLPIDSGFVFGTNRYFDRAKATAFTLPNGQTDGTISQVKVWFGYKRTGLTNESYSIAVYNGDASTGPVGEPIAAQQYMLADINADDNFATDEDATVHPFPEPVSVGSDFIVAVDFGSYQAAGIGNAGIAATERLGQRIPEVWEQWSDGTWHNVSDAWLGNQSAPGSGTDGWHMWMEVVLGGTVSAPDERRSIPTTLSLEQNYPNPFNPMTLIRFSLPEQEHVSLIVYDVLGREIEQLIDREIEAGTHTIEFNGNGLSSGLYFYRLNTGNTSIVKRMMLVR